MPSTHKQPINNRQNMQQMCIIMKQVWVKAARWCWLHPTCVAGLCGVGLTLGFAPFFCWPLALVALAAMAWLVRQLATFRQAAFVSSVFAFCFFVSSLYWLPRSFMVDMGTGMGLLAGVPALLGLSVLLSPAVAAPLLAHRLAARCLPARAACNLWGAGSIFVLVWLAGELIRGLIFPWNLLGYVWADNLWLMQHAAWGSVYALSGLCAAVAVVFSCGKKAAVEALSGLAVLMAAGAWVFYNPLAGENVLAKQPGAEADVLYILAVQPNINQAHKWDVSKRFDNVRAAATLTQQAQTNKTSPTPAAQVVVWPETAVPFFLQQEQPLREDLATLLAPGQRLVTGTVELQNDNRIFNSIVVMDNTGVLQAVYQKHILVPFGEYIPFRRMIPAFISPMVAGQTDYSAGTGTVTLPVAPGVQALPLVCFEALFPFFVHRHAAGKNVIINLTNDAWFDRTTSPHQHFAMARLRAVETRLPLIRVANSGITAVITPKGVIQGRIKIRHSATLAEKIDLSFSHNVLND